MNQDNPASFEKLSPAPNERRTAAPARRTPAPNIAPVGVASNQQVVTLGRRTLGANDQRLLRYRSRIDAALAGLQKDMDLWAGVFAADDSARVLRHHLEQFRTFVQHAYFLLIGENLQPLPDRDAAALRPPEIAPASAAQAEKEDFREMVVGVLTAQWLLLRNVIVQRVQGSPYLGVDANSGLQALDADARTYYRCLYDVLNTKLERNSSLLNWRYRKQPLVKFAPLVHLGNSIQLAVFNRRTPLVISVPVGALPEMPSSDLTRMAIPHEVAHAVFVQVPELIEELGSKVRAKLDTTNRSRQSMVLYDMVLNWTEEICADLVGTALAGEQFADSARWIMASSDASLNVSNSTHPPAILRPVIHLLALARIEQKVETVRFDALREGLRTEIGASNTESSVLARQFKSVPALMFVKLETVYDALTTVVRHLLDAKLKILGGETLGALLAEIYRARMQPPPDDEKSREEELEKWGEIPVAEEKEFVIDFPLAVAAPVYATPGVSNHPFLCEVEFLAAVFCPKDS